MQPNKGSKRYVVMVGPPMEIGRPYSEHDAILPAVQAFAEAGEKHPTWDRALFDTLRGECWVSVSQTGMAVAGA